LLFLFFALQEQQQQQNPNPSNIHKNNNALCWDTHRTRRILRTTSTQQRWVIFVFFEVQEQQPQQQQSETEPHQQQQQQQRATPPHIVELPVPSFVQYIPLDKALKYIVNSTDYQISKMRYIFQNEKEKMQWEK
jgi:hypothetical protein